MTTPDSETPLSSSLRLVASGARFSLGAQGIIFMLEFALAIFLARSLGPAGLGILATVFAISSLIVLLAGLQLETQAARSTDETWVPRAFAWSLLAGGGAVGLGVLTAVVLNAFQRPEQALVLFAYLPFLLLEPAIGLLRGALRAAGRSAAASGYRVLAPLLRVLVLIPLTSHLLESSPARVAFAFSAAEVVLFMVGLWLLRASGWIRLAPRWTDGQALVREHSSLLIIAVAWLIILRTDLIMVAQIVGEREAGAYHVTLRLGEVIQQIYSALLVMFLPALASLRTADDLRTAWRSTSYVTATILIPIVVPLAIWGDVIVGPIFGQGFVLGTGVYVLVAAGLFIHVLSGPSGYLLLVAEQRRELVIISIGTSVLNVVLNAFFIPKWAVAGAAFATSLSLLGMGAMYVGTVKKTFSYGHLGHGYVPWALGLTAALVAYHVGLRSWSDSVPAALVAGVTGAGLAVGATRIYRPARTATDSLRGRKHVQEKRPV